MIPLNHILGIRLEKITHQIIYKVDIKVFAKNKKIIGDTDTNNMYIYIYRDGIWQRKMCNVHNEK